MVIWTMTGGGKSKESGLSPGQVAGEVAGEYVVRPAGSPETQTYIPGVGSTSVMIEGGATAGRGRIGVRGTTTVQRDRYGNVIRVRQTDASGNIVFERKTTPGGGFVEEGLPTSTQSRYAQIQSEREMLPLYRRRAEYNQKQQAVERQQQASIARSTTAFQLPILAGTQNRYLPTKKTFTVLEGRTSQEYYKTYPHIPKEGTPYISEPLQSFGKNIFGEPQGEPQPGKTYRKDWLGNYVEVSPMKSKTVSAKEFEAIRQADIYAPLLVPIGALSTTSALKGASLNIRLPKIKFPVIKQKITYDMKALEGMALIPKKKTRLKLIFKEKTEVQPKTEVIDLSKAEPLPSSKYKTITDIYSGGEPSVYTKKAFTLDVAMVRAQEARQRAMYRFNLGSLSLLSQRQKYSTKLIPSLPYIQNNIFKQPVSTKTGLKTPSAVKTKPITITSVKMQSLSTILSKTQIQPVTIKQPPKKPPFFRPPTKPIILKMPSFEMPDILGQGRRRKQVTRGKTIRTRMLSLADLFRR